jgi:hypothetical protein
LELTIKSHDNYYITYGNKGNKSYTTASVPDDIDPGKVTLEIALTYIQSKNREINERINSYLYYHKDGTIEYIVNNGKYENNRYLMIKDTNKPKAKPSFLSFPFDEELEGINFERIKELAEVGKKNKYQKKAKVTDDKENKSNPKAKPKAKLKANPKANLKANPKANLKANPKEKKIRIVKVV